MFTGCKDTGNRFHFVRQREAGARPSLEPFESDTQWGEACCKTVAEGWAQDPTDRCTAEMLVSALAESLHTSHGMQLSTHNMNMTMGA